MKNYKRTKAVYIRVSPELLELVDLSLQADYGKLAKCSLSDVIHKSVARVALYDLVWSDRVMMERALELARGMFD